jgi:hypothetical protein
MSYGLLRYSINLFIIDLFQSVCIINVLLSPLLRLLLQPYQQLNFLITS